MGSLGNLEKPEKAAALEVPSFVEVRRGCRHGCRQPLRKP